MEAPRLPDCAESGLQEDFKKGKCWRSQHRCSRPTGQPGTQAHSRPFNVQNKNVSLRHRGNKKCPHFPTSTERQTGNSHILFEYCLLQKWFNIRKSIYVIHHIVTPKKNEVITSTKFHLFMIKNVQNKNVIFLT